MLSSVLAANREPLQWRHSGHYGVSNRQPYGCLLNRLKKTSKFRVTFLCEGISSVTGEFPAQRASDAENVSIWWHHHDMYPPCWTIPTENMSVRTSVPGVFYSCDCYMTRFYKICILSLRYQVYKFRYIFSSLGSCISNIDTRKFVTAVCKIKHIFIWTSCTYMYVHDDTSESPAKNVAMCEVVHR